MTTQYIKVNWEGADYHGFPLVDSSTRYPQEEDGEIARWAQFDAVLAEAKNGNFSGVRKLLAVYDAADWQLGSACADLMGEIGGRQFFDELRPAVTHILEPSYSIDLGCSLAVWGHLSAVPTLLETLDKLADFVDAPFILERLSMMLEPELGELGDSDALNDIEAYSAKVTQRVHGITSRLGTDDAIVMFGELFSVEKLLGVIRQRLTRGGVFDPYLRHKFEATTGVDCSGFYEDGVLRPLQALALLEEFEDRGDVKRYQPGLRYFFGHRVPD